MVLQLRGNAGLSATRLHGTPEPHRQSSIRKIFVRWLDVKNVEAEEVARFLKPTPEDCFVFEPTLIERKPLPPKPRAQLSLFWSSVSSNFAD